MLGLHLKINLIRIKIIKILFAMHLNKINISINFNPKTAYLYLKYRSTACLYFIFSPHFVKYIPQPFK